MEGPAGGLKPEEVRINGTSAEDSPWATAWRSPSCSMDDGMEVVGFAQEKLAGYAGQASTASKGYHKRSASPSSGYFVVYTFIPMSPPTLLQICMMHGIFVFQVF